MSVVPDSIEPIVGWKSMDITAGQLCSPMYETPWKSGQPIEAECHCLPGRFMWRPLHLPGPEEGMTLQYVTENLWAWFGMNPNESIPSHLLEGLAKGWEWRLMYEESKHAAPGEECACGIHIANKLEEAVVYGHDKVFVKVLGWGKTIPGTRASRVQYAYPAEIYVTEKRDISKLAHYGVPVLLKQELGFKETTVQKLYRRAVPDPLTILGIAFVAETALFFNAWRNDKILGMIASALSMIVLASAGWVIHRCRN